MAWGDINSKLTFTGVSEADTETVRGIMENAYNKSETAKEMFDDWVATEGHTISVRQTDGGFQAIPGEGIIKINLSDVEDTTMIDNNGNAVASPVARSVLHELVHAFTDLRDNWNDDESDWRGDTVNKTNEIMAEIDDTAPARNSYIAVDSDGEKMPEGFAFTGGTAIDRSVLVPEEGGSFNAGDIDRDDLLIGDNGSNVLEGGGGDDWLYGGGGSDVLNGGLGGTDTVRYDGNATDYNLTLLDSGVWSANHVRGDADDGVDFIKNVEKVMFNDGTYNLAKGGLSYQTDFAIVVDQTGSMWDDIDAVKATSVEIVNALFADGKTDARIGLVGFRDTTIGEPTEIMLPFTNQNSFAERKAEALKGINSLYASGGGDLPESAFDGLLKALDGSLGEWRAGAGTKRVVLFTDASAKDAHLAATVAGFAENIGASITGTTSKEMGTMGVTDTFDLFIPATDVSDASGFFPKPEDYPEYVPSGDPIEAPGSVATVSITTIWVGSGTTDADLARVSEESGGAVIAAEDAEDVAEAILAIVKTPHFTITTPTYSVKEGADGDSQEVTFTVARDRSEGAAVVTLETTGRANGSDVTMPALEVEFADGELSKDITVTVNGDGMFEGNETFGIKIADVDIDATFGEDSAGFIILNDDVLKGSNSDDVLTGKNGDDRIFGKGGNDVIKGKAGDDVVKAGGGNDKVKGNGGDDLLKGMGGKDKLFGGAGDDVLIGGGGRDMLKGQAGDDTLVGGGGADRFVFRSGDGDDTVKKFSITDDKIVLRGVAEVDDFDGLSAVMTQDGDNVLIDALAGDTITLVGVELDLLTEDNFIF